MSRDIPAVNKISEAEEKEEKSPNKENNKGSQRYMKQSLS
jgi:hypothetical protein